MYIYIYKLLWKAKFALQILQGQGRCLLCFGLQYLSRLESLRTDVKRIDPEDQRTRLYEC